MMREPHLFPCVPPRPPDWSRKSPEIPMAESEKPSLYVVIHRLCIHLCIRLSTGVRLT
jgi:hypothetical protein